MARQSEETSSTPSQLPQRSQYAGHPLTSLRDQMDRLFDDFFTGGSMLRPGSLWDSRWAKEFGLPSSMPSVDVVEEDKELVVTAELPGIDEKDVEVTLDQGILTIRGEKKSESERKEERMTVSERRYGSFQRSLSLPEGIDEDQVSARFDKGVLTVRIARKPEAVRQAKRIPIGS